MGDANSDDVIAEETVHDCLQNLTTTDDTKEVETAVGIDKKPTSLTRENMVENDDMEIQRIKTENMDIDNDGETISAVHQVQKDVVVEIQALGENTTEENSDVKEIETANDVTLRTLLTTTTTIDDDDNDDGEKYENSSSSSAPPVFFEQPTYEALKSFLGNYYDETNTLFCTMSVSKGFGNPVEECDLSGHSIVWKDTYSKSEESSIEKEWDGIPRMIVGTVSYSCQFGRDKYRTYKDKLKAKKQKLQSEGVVVRRRKETASKKIGCPVRINVRQVIRFPEFKCVKTTKFAKSNASRKLRAKLRDDPESLKKEMVFVGHLPAVTDHQFHSVKHESEKEPVYEPLRKMIIDLYLQKQPVPDIVISVKDYVKGDLFFNQQPPCESRRKYYPKRRDANNFIRRFVELSGFNREQEDKMAVLVENICSKHTRNHIVSIATDFLMEQAEETTAQSQSSSSEDEFFDPDPAPKTKKNKRKKPASKQKTIHEKKTPSPFKPYLICYQSNHHFRLLQRYNSSTAFLLKCPDEHATRAIPFHVFLIMIQTNVDFQVVGMIICSKLKKDGLLDGLSIFKDWNTGWQPKYWLVDYQDEITKAIDITYPGTEHFYIAHSCEEHWNRFLSKPSNQLLDHREEIIESFRSMLYSYTEESLTTSAANFEQSTVWRQSEVLREWFQAEWIHDAKKWVLGYHPSNLLYFQHQSIDIQECIQPFVKLLNQFDGKRETVSHTIEKLIDLVDKEYTTYIQRNTYFRASCRGFLRERGICNINSIPEPMVTFIYEQTHVIKNLDEIVISEDDETGSFLVVYNAPETGQQASCQVGDEDNDIQTEFNNLGELVRHALQQRRIIEVNNRQQLCNSKPTIHGKPLLTLQAAAKIAESGTFKVSFGDHENSCFCSCTFWQMFKIPCMHMVAIFNNLHDWHYDMLSPLYRRSNVFVYDNACISNSHRLWKEKSPPLEKSIQTDKIPNKCLMPAVNENRAKENKSTKPKDSVKKTSGVYKPSELKIHNYKILMSEVLKVPTLKGKGYDKETVELKVIMQDNSKEEIKVLTSPPPAVQKPINTVTDKTDETLNDNQEKSSANVGDGDVMESVKNDESIITECEEEETDS